MLFYNHNRIEIGQKTNQYIFRNLSICGFSGVYICTYWINKPYKTRLYGFVLYLPRFNYVLCLQHKNHWKYSFHFMQLGIKMAIWGYSGIHVNIWNYNSPDNFERKNPSSGLAPRPTYVK